MARCTVRLRGGALAVTLGALALAAGGPAQAANSLGPPTPPPAGDPDAMAPIGFDLAALTDDGLYGPPTGLRALAYEFCIPATEAHVREVTAIDPSLQILRRSPGRAGCTAAQYLCIGSTHQPDFRAVLLRLAQRPYIERIEPSVAE